jgi:predicted oxidoreductase
MRREYDVLIAGSGIAGMAAACEAAGAGLRVLVVEAQAEPGGASAISGGASCIVGTPLQAAVGLKDSVELALADWARAGGPEADLAWARKYLAASRSEVYDWCERAGVVWQGPQPHPSNSVPRGHRPVGGGAAVTAAVTSAALGRGVARMTSTRLDRLLTQDGGVVGAVLATEAGERELGAAAVLMATGGFVSNPSMLRHHAPALRGVRRFLCGGAWQATGSGHRVLEAVGAAFTCLEHVWIYPDGTPDPLDPSGARGVLVRGPKTEVWLNEHGERFHDETDASGGTGAPALLAQPGQHCWAIFDARTKQAVDLRDNGYYGLPLQPNRERIDTFFATSPYVRQANSIAALARAADLPVDTVGAELEAFNAAISSGARRDPRTGRDLRGARAITDPPFFAVEYMPTVQKNLGGVRTDLDGRVLRPDGSVVPGLFAAGELAGMAGGHINGRGAIENTMFAPCLFSGRVAGAAAAAWAGRSPSQPTSPDEARSPASLTP